MLCVILDGFGKGPDNDANAITQAKMPYYQYLQHHAYQSELFTHGAYVGLPDGIMGNSEVGHMTLGAGRILESDLVTINRAIREKTFFTNPTLLAACRTKTVNLFGLLSDAGVHSHIDHLFALLDMTENAQIHAFLDGRDTPPGSARTYLLKLMQHPAVQEGRAKISSLCGRSFGMDRDNRWERTDAALLCMQGKGACAQDLLAYLDTCLATDEFIPPMRFTEYSPGPWISWNFRADRIQQMAKRLTPMTTMTPIDPTIPHQAAFIQVRNPGFGDRLARHHLRQLRIAETEKFAHVTYFFNQSQHEPHQGESHILIPSVRDVPTYDLAPAMSAFALTEKTIQNLGTYDFILLNLANADMVGHTGNLQAAIQACEVLDTALMQLGAACKEKGIDFFITADHGNIEVMRDHEGRPHTQHTLSPVPCLFLPKEARTIRMPEGSLASCADFFAQQMHL